MTEQEIRDRLKGEEYTREDFENTRRNYLVEAGAGAGKTTIMVERIVNQLVTAFCEPEDLVAITFTNKSTLELRKRLDEELRKRRVTAEKSGDRELQKRLEYLLRESGRMQVSTIHSFCQTMLEAMPFTSPLGLDMQTLEPEEPEAKAFFRRRLLEDRTLFRDARGMGINTGLLEKCFLDLCGNGEAELVYCRDQGMLGRWKNEVTTGVLAFQQKLHLDTDKFKETVIDPVVREISGMQPSAFAANRNTAAQLIWRSLSSPEKCPRNQNEKKRPNAQAKEVLSAADKVWTAAGVSTLRRSAGPLLHSYVMRDMETLLEEYRAEKRKKHLASYDDLLLRCRDMLRDSEEARRYFHDRYKVLYVDEMQDTDPVQTELLFYLTTDEQDFDGNDWRNCRPVPGSLFLVGDPKQAIYRFRGADIGVYNTLLKLFQSGEDLAANGPDPKAVGEKVTLRYNFRSAKEICDLADRVFEPNAADPKDCQFTGGTYHAQYVSMDARNGSCTRARTLAYIGLYEKRKNRAGRSNNCSIEPRQVAAFIRTMVDKGIVVGNDYAGSDPGKKPHAARYGDFLILTSSKRAAGQYTDALKELGVDSEVVGEAVFSDVMPVRRGVLHLQSLLARRDDRLLIRVLRECYPGAATRDETLRRLLLRTDKGSLTGLLYPKQMADIRLALEAETPRDEELVKLCAILEEIARLRRMADTLPAMAVLERLMEGGYGLWDGEEDRNQRRKTYAVVQQYLNLVRGYPERSFPALAAYAIECAGKEYEHTLELEPADNVVRVMNLHKAKGLEAEVVILAESWKRDRPPRRHVVRSGGTVKEYRTVAYTERFGKVAYVAGWPEGWEQGAQAEEKRYQDAEDARLLYVAATRAKTMLLACCGSFMPEKANDEKTPYWKPLTDQMELARGNDPLFGEAFQALITGCPAALQAPGTSSGQPGAPQAAGNSTGPSPVSVEPDVMEEQLEADSAKLAENRVYAITPSRLEHQARSVVNRPDEAEPEETEETAASAPAPEDEEKDEGLTAPAEDSETASPAEVSDGPYGPDWGTIVHRVMELAVRSGETASEKLLEFARQAVFETLPEGTVTEKQRKMLGFTAGGKNPMEYLAQQAAGAASFLSDENSGLWRMMQGARCFPELPFFLRAEKDDEQTGELYRHLSDHITSDDARDRALAVQGVIDLAILTEDGWYVVDYKTDKRLDSEDEETFRQRLRGEYTPQITAYARVLEQLEKGPVKGAYLCSVPLSGELIELDIAPGTP